ncbi:MAG: tRNA (adenosine(37)-N6)-threonylcarbamoyltransferase complex dimerization subunit type 1 TsaB [Pseudomonadota bacterium]
MNLLALDTSTEVCSAALSVDGEVTLRFDGSGARNTDIILPMIDQLLADSGTPRSALDGVVFGRGPGSFTGVRVAAGITQGIAFGLDLPVLPLSTLLLLAEAARLEHGSECVATVNDARMSEVYSAAWAYRGEENALGGWEMIVAEAVQPPGQWQFPSADESGLATGTGFAAYPDDLPLADGWTLDQQLVPRADRALSLARRVPDSAWQPVEGALPVYLRNNVAKKKTQR